MAESKARLGKGLGALLGESLDEAQEARGPVRDLPLTDLRPNPFQPRREIREETIHELVESIRENGLLQPLVVRPGSSGSYQIVAGERRYRALRVLERERAPVVVRELTDEQMLVLAMVENLQRENLSPLEEAAGYRELVDQFGYTQQEVARRVGRDRSTVANTLRLLDLPEPVQELLDRDELTGSHARAILGLDSGAEQVALAREVVEEGLSVRATERRVRERRDGGSADDEGKPPTSRSSRRDSGADRVARRAEQLLGRALGTEIRIRLEGDQSGEIRVPFHDSSDFERLVEALVGDAAGELFDRV